MSGVEIIKVQPSGVTLYKNVLTLDQSEELYGHLNQQGWESRNNQEIQYYGYRYDSRAMKLKGGATVPLFEADKFTKLLKCMAKALVSTGILKDEPNQITIVKYDPTDGGPSRAVTYPYPMYGKQGAILNLGSSANMMFSSSNGGNISVKLPVGSIMVFEGAAREKYSQYITEDYKRGTYMSILFLRNTIPSKPILGDPDDPGSSGYKKTISRKPRVREPNPSDVNINLGMNKSYGSRKRTGTCFSRSNIEMKPHQIKIVKYLETHRGVIAAYATGSGKTLIAIMAAECFLDKNPNGRIVVITPTSARDGFKENMDKKYGISSKDSKYCFYGYQEFANHYSFKSNTIRLEEGEKTRLDAGSCISCENVFLIVDEAHELRTLTPWAMRLPIMGLPELTGKRAIRIIQCAAVAAKVLLLTATPIVNDPYDLANLVAMVRGEAPPSEAAFYEIAGVKPRYPGLLGTKVLKPFRKELGNLKSYQGPRDFESYFCGAISFFKHTKDKNWPSEEETWMPIEMDPEYYNTYRNIEKKQEALYKSHAYFDKEGHKTFKDPHAYLTILAQATNAIENSAKIKEVIKYIKNRKDGEKILIYSGYLRAGLDEIKKVLDERFYEKRKGYERGDEQVPISMDALKAEAKNRHIKVDGDSKKAYIEALREYVEITGKITKLQRERSRLRFNDPHSGLDIMLISKAGGMALDLKGVEKVLILESLWNRPTEEQIKGRAIRFKSHSETGLPKSRQHVKIIHLVLTKPGSFNRDPENPAIVKQARLLLTKPGMEAALLFKGEIDDDDNGDSADISKMMTTLEKDITSKAFEEKLIEMELSGC